MATRATSVGRKSYIFYFLSFNTFLSPTPDGASKYLYSRARDVVGFDGVDINALIILIIVIISYLVV